MCRQASRKCSTRHQQVNAILRKQLKSIWTSPANVRSSAERRRTWRQLQNIYFVMRIYPDTVYKLVGGFIDKYRVFRILIFS